jgi:plasmid stabilization system protein ParE
VGRVRDVLRRIAANPKLHAAVHQDVRKATVAQFPFVVLYREDQGEVVVVAVFHTSRDPADWQSRV